MSRFHPARPAGPAGPSSDLLHRSITEAVVLHLLADDFEHGELGYGEPGGKGWRQWSARSQSSTPFDTCQSIW
jgi:hypothetical protein